jgi:hypothetical protein
MALKLPQGNATYILLQVCSECVIVICPYGPRPCTRTEKNRRYLLNLLQIIIKCLCFLTPLAGRITNLRSVRLWVSFNLVLYYWILSPIEYFDLYYAIGGSIPFLTSFSVKCPNLYTFRSFWHINKLINIVRKYNFLLFDWLFDRQIACLIVVKQLISL